MIAQTPKEKNLAVRNYKRAVKLLNLGVETRKAIKLLLQSAKAGYILAQLELAHLALIDKYEMSYKEAVKLFKYFSDLDNPSAHLQLGYCYDHGLGVRKNSKKAFELYAKAAGYNLDQAMFNLALCYEDGIGVGKNQKKALLWYRRAAKNKNYEAINTLGYFYLNGEGVRKNYKKALSLFLKSVEGKYCSAFTNIGVMYLDGNGVKQDKKIALRYLRKGAKLGSKLAKEIIAEMT